MKHRVQLVAAAIALLLVNPSAAQAAWVEVSTDGDTFQVRGGVIHDDDYEGDRTEAATCTDCYWTIEAVCQSFLVGSQGNCPRLRSRCPTGMRPVQVMRANATSRPPKGSALWHHTGYSCVGDEGPASTGRIREELTGGWQVRVPPMTWTVSPPQHTLVRLPTSVVFKSPARIVVRRAVVDGVAVTLSAVASRSVSCSSSGCTKLLSRSASFGSAGRHYLTLRSVWRGTYSALGLTNLPVTDDAIVQTRQIAIEVKELRRRLS